MYYLQFCNMGLGYLQGSSQEMWVQLSAVKHLRWQAKAAYPGDRPYQNMSCEAARGRE